MSYTSVGIRPKNQTRLGLNEEIKRLNAQRAAFSPVPLKEQIKELDRLMSRLDGRVQRLKLLSEKTSLPERILKLVTSLFHTAKSLLVVRTQDEAARTLRAAERDTKAERQKARYGKTYRASVHERMGEMRENMGILQTKKTQYHNYKSFVDMVERHVEVVRPSLKIPALPVRTEWKETTSTAELKAKIVLEAAIKREKVPIEHKPTIKHEPLTKNFKAALTSSPSTLSIGNPAMPIKEVLKGDGPKRPEKPFTAAATAHATDNADRSVWHKEVTVKIKSLDQIRAERAPIILTEPMDSPKVWKVEASEQSRIILQRMQADIGERKAALHVPNASGFSGSFNNPTKIVTETEAIQKVRSQGHTCENPV